MAIIIRDVEANGLLFRCRMTTSSGEPVIFLHGFPETSHAWTEVMAALEKEGYACLAPDQRGYSPGARPAEVERYTLPRLADDVIALADALGFGHFHLVGHDWGAAVGWTVLRSHAPRVVSWCALSLPHLASYAAGFADPEQRQKSKYIQRCVVPGLAEQDLSQHDFALLKQEWNRHCPDKTDEYTSIFSQPGALTATLAYYRANFDETGVPGADFAPFDVHTPSLTIWGNRDPAVGSAATRLEKEMMKGPYRFVELDAGHRLAHERRADVIAELLAHLRAFPLAVPSRSDPRHGPPD